MAPDSWGTSWDSVVEGQLAGATCLWQDLDGLHVSAAPAAAPPTSIMWGWRPDGTLLRIRLDGRLAFVAELDPATAADAANAVRTVPLDVRAGENGDSRVAGVRGPRPEDGGAGAVYEQVVIDGIADGVGPVTFLRPAPSQRRPATRQTAGRAVPSASRKDQKAVDGIPAVKTAVHRSQYPASAVWACPESGA
jgi:hypothetical protein